VNRFLIWLMLVALFDGGTCAALRSVVEPATVLTSE
jgi:hypothetical protein